MVLFFGHHDSNLQKIAEFRWLTLQWTVFCMLMQLGTNLHNDYSDFVKGADDDRRVGQPRATQRGWLTPSQTARAAGWTLLGGFAVGVHLLYQMWHSPVACWEYLVFTCFIVGTSCLNAFAYTGGDWPLGYLGMGDLSIGYSGLGDLFVFLYFGLVATLMLPFLYLTIIAEASGSDLTNEIWKVAPYAVQVAVLAVNIIVVNNLRDRHTDVHADKRTLAVRFGATFCRTEYVVNLAIAYGILLWMAVGAESKSPIEIWKRLLPLLTTKLAWKEWKAVSVKEGSALNPHVGGAAKVQLFFCILLAISMRISSR
jgi:1,4-dihydroxy-2-naphthoate octaprenyltransferase